MGNLIGAGDTPNQQQKKIMADLSASKPMLCVGCGYDVFLPAIKLRKISKLMIGSTADQILPLDVFVCGNCGAVTEELLPIQIRTLEAAEKQQKSSVIEPE